MQDLRLAIRALRGTPVIATAAILVGRTVTVALDVPPTGTVSLGARTIVGIVGDAVYRSIREPVPPTIYMPLAQNERPLFFSVFFMAVRPAAGSPAQMIQSVSAALHAVNPDLRLTLRPASEQVNALLAQDRLAGWLPARRASRMNPLDTFAPSPRHQEPRCPCFAA